MSKNWSIVKSAFKNLAVARSLTVNKKVRTPKKHRGHEDYDGDEGHQNDRKVGVASDDDDDDDDDNDDDIHKQGEKIGKPITNDDRTFGVEEDLTMFGKKNNEKGNANHGENDDDDEYDDGDDRSGRRRPSSKTGKKEKKSKHKKHSKRSKGSSGTGTAEPKESKKKKHKSRDAQQQQQETPDDDTTTICQALGMDTASGFCLRHPNQSITSLGHQYEPVYTCRICASETEAGPRAASRQRKSMAAVIVQVQKLQADKRSWRQRTNILHWAGSGNNSSEDDDNFAKVDDKEELISEGDWMQQVAERVLQVDQWKTGGAAALRYHPDYERYFRLLNVGVPLESMKATAAQDGKDPTVLDLDPDKSLESQRSSKSHRPGALKTSNAKFNDDDEEDDEEYLEVPNIVEKVRISFNRRRSSQMLAVASRLMLVEKNLHLHHDDEDDGAGREKRGKHSSKHSKKKSTKGDDDDHDDVDNKGKPTSSQRSPKKSKKKSKRNDDSDRVDDSSNAIRNDDSDRVEDSLHAVSSHGGDHQEREATRKKKGKEAKTKESDRSKSRGQSESRSPRSPKKRKVDDKELIIQQLKQELRTKDALIDELQEKVKTLEQKVENMKAPIVNRGISRKESLGDLSVQSPDRRLRKGSVGEEIHAASFDNKSLDRDGLFDVLTDDTPAKSPVLAPALEGKAEQEKLLGKLYSHLLNSPSPFDEKDTPDIEIEPSKNVPRHLMSLHQPSRKKTFDDVSLDDDELFDPLPASPPPSKPLLAAAMKARKEQYVPRHLVGVNQPARTVSLDNISLDDDELFDPVPVDAPPAKPMLTAALKAKAEQGIPQHLARINQPHTTRSFDSSSLDDDDIFLPVSNEPIPNKPLLAAALKAKAEMDVPQHLTKVNQPSRTRSFDNISLDDDEVFEPLPKEPTPDKPWLAAALKAKSQKDALEHLSNPVDDENLEGHNLLPSETLIIAAPDARAEPGENVSEFSSSGNDQMLSESLEPESRIDSSNVVPEHMLNLNQPTMLHPSDNASLDNDDLFDVPSEDPPTDRPLLRAALRAREQQQDGLVPSHNVDHLANGSNGHHYETVPDHLITANQPGTVSSHDEYSIDEDDLFDIPPDDPPNPKPLLNAAMKARAQQEENMVDSSHLEHAGVAMPQSDGEEGLAQNELPLLRSSNPSTQLASSGTNLEDSQGSVQRNEAGEARKFGRVEIESEHAEQSNGAHGKSESQDSHSNANLIDAEDNEVDDMLDDIARLFPASVRENNDDDSDSEAELEEGERGAPPLSNSLVAIQNVATREETTVATKQVGAEDQDDDEDEDENENDDDDDDSDDDDYVDDDDDGGSIDSDEYEDDDSENGEKAREPLLRGNAQASTSRSHKEFSPDESDGQVVEENANNSGDDETEEDEEDETEEYESDSDDDSDQDNDYDSIGSDEYESDDD